MYKTGNPVPSIALEDMADNAQTFDALVTKTEGTTTDRLGRTRRVFQQILMDMGFKPLAGSFQTGETITARNQTLYDEVSHVFYAWGGTIPVGGYVVKAGSTPTPLGSGGWIDRSDVTLRGDITKTAFVKSNASDFGTLQSSVDDAIANGRSVVEVTQDVTTTGLTSKGSVAFVGGGEVFGVDRKRVADPIDPTFLAWNDINPTAHLYRFLSKTNPVVVVVGDSIATDSANSLGRTECLYSALQQRLTTAYPDKNITFHNRAIGGETYFSAVGVPSSFPVWYTNPAGAWCVYVGALNPDLVIFNFGMNDTVYFQSVTVRTYAETLMTNPALFPAGKPDIIYCTNLTPSVNTTAAGFADSAGQDGRDMCAGYTRTYAKANGYGLLDFHRMCTILKDGFDPCSSYLTRHGAVTPVSGAIVAPIKCVDFRLEMTVSGLPVGSPMAVKLGSAEVLDTAGRGGFVQLTNSGGLLNVTLYDTPSHIYADVSPVSFLVPSSAFSLSVEKKQSTLIIEVNGSVVVTYNKLVNNGRTFFPSVGDATYQTGSITACTFYYGEFVTYKQGMLNDDIWGNSAGLIKTKYPLGGNGINHPSSLAIARIFRSVLDFSSFTDGTRAESDTVRISLINGWSRIGGFAAPAISRISGQVTISLHLTPPTAGATGNIAVIPEKYRPNAGITVFCRLYGTGATGGATAQITPDGAVSVVNSTSEAYLYGHATWFK